MIDYTDTVWNENSATRFIPSFFHAFIASVNATQGINYFGDFQDNNQWILRVISTTDLKCAASEIQICSSLGGGAYLAVVGKSAGNPYLAAVALRNTVDPDWKIGGTSWPLFFGVDIERDDNGNPPMGEKYGCIVACGANTVNTNFVSFFLDADTKTINGPFTLVTPGAYEWARYPALCPDSSVNPIHHDGGILAAWDWEYPSGSQPHTVQTNRLSFNGTNWVFTLPTIDLVVHFDSALYPDIARLSVDGDTAAFIVYEGQGEQCSPGRPIEVLGNWVIYDSSSIHRGEKWLSPKLIGPGSGSFSQRHPMALTSVGGSVNVFWYDARSSVDHIMGTRTWPVDSIDINWGKAAMDEDVLPIATIRLGEIYPNPISLSKSRFSSIVVEATSGQSARLELYDNLGRLVGTIYDAALSPGRYVMQLDVSQFTPGLYHYLLHSGSGVSSRGMIVVR